VSINLKTFSPPAIADCSIVYFSAMSVTGLKNICTRLINAINAPKEIDKDNAILLPTTITTAIVNVANHSTIGLNVANTYISFRFAFSSS
jgi:hypothetical protein